VVRCGEREEEKRKRKEKEKKKMVEKLALELSCFWRKSRSFSGGRRSWCEVEVGSEGGKSEYATSYATTSTLKPQ
jgi:hypothetical protein